MRQRLIIGVARFRGGGQIQEGNVTSYRLRIKRRDGTVSVVDQSHSQMCETTRGLSRADFRRFLKGESVTVQNGDNVKLVSDAV